MAAPDGVLGKGNRQVKTRRWMEKVLDETNKEQIDLPYSREMRAVRRAVKLRMLIAAE